MVDSRLSKSFIIGSGSSNYVNNNQ